jgi:hypothetical protein
MVFSHRFVFVPAVHSIHFRFAMQALSLSSLSPRRIPSIIIVFVFDLSMNIFHKRLARPRLKKKTIVPRENKE